jgi:Flp pilus assembly protein TadD
VASTETTVLSPITLAAAILAAAAVTGAQAVPYVATLRLHESQAAAANGQLDDSLNEARTAQRLEPWAASPYTQEALVEERQGRLARASRAIRQAIERDEKDWALWLIRARLETKMGEISAARSSLEEVRRLNPRSPLVRSLGP